MLRYLVKHKDNFFLYLCLYLHRTYVFCIYNHIQRSIIYDYYAVCACEMVYRREMNRHKVQ
jgi:hypothetical protein